MRSIRRLPLAALLAAFALLAAGCGGADTAQTPAETTSAPAEATPDTATSPTEDRTGTEDMTGTEAMASGAACDQLPEGSAAGGLDAMAQQPAATAASTNPLLSTLVTAVGAAGLGDTLNSEGPFTIFAPVNDAFAEIPQSDLEALLADTDGLTDVLTYHVRQGEALTSTDLAGMDSLEMVNGSDITLSASGDSLDVNGQAMVVCADIMVANGVVHLIDGVLMPS